MNSKKLLVIGNRRFILALLVSFLLQACGGGGGGSGSSSGGSSSNPSSATTDNAITASITKGPVDGATCNLHEWRDGSQGEKIAGPVLSGSGSIDFGTIASAHEDKTMVITCEGGSYQDESDASEQRAGKMRTVVQYTNGRLQVAITPITEVAFQKTNSENLLDFESKAKEIARALGLPDSFDPIYTIPKDANTETLASDDESRYAAVLASMAMYSRTKEEVGNTRYQTMIDKIGQSYISSSGGAYSSGFTEAFKEDFEKAMRDMRQLKPLLVPEVAMPTTQEVTAATSDPSNENKPVVDSITPSKGSNVAINGIYSQGTIISGINIFTLTGKNLKGFFSRVELDDQPRNADGDTIGKITFDRAGECEFFDNASKAYSEMQVGCFLRKATQAGARDTLTIYNRQNEVIFTGDYTVTLPEANNVHQKRYFSVSINSVTALKTDDLSLVEGQTIAADVNTSFKVAGRDLQYLAGARWDGHLCTQRSLNADNTEVIYDCGSHTSPAGTSSHYTLTLSPAAEDNYTIFLVANATTHKTTFQVLGAINPAFTDSDGLTAQEKQVACGTNLKLDNADDNRSETFAYDNTRASLCDYYYNESAWYKTLWADGAEAYFADGPFSGLYSAGQTAFPLHLDPNGGVTSSQLENLPINDVTDVTMCKPGFMNGVATSCIAPKITIKALGCGSNQPNVYQIKNVPHCDMAYIYKRR